MSRASSLAVDDDPVVPRVITRDLRARYGADYRGDARLDARTRVVSAVGDGAMSVHLVHRYLATTWATM